jgi:hypothetical protein
MMHRFGGGPYYAVELPPSTRNTQGGPRLNETAQVVRPDGLLIGACCGFGRMTP